MQLIKKTLRRRAKLCYNAAIFLSLTSLTIADAARSASLKNCKSMLMRFSKCLQRMWNQDVVEDAVNKKVCVVLNIGKNVI